MSAIIESPWYEERVKTYPGGRVCSHIGCDTILSRYNPSTFCAAHEPEPELLHYEGYTFRVCECGEVFQVPKSGGSRLCHACKRAAILEERKRHAFREATKPLRKDGRKDAVQRAQRKVAAQAAAPKPAPQRIAALRPDGSVVHYEVTP